MSCVVLLLEFVVYAALGVYLVLKTLVDSIYVLLPKQALCFSARIIQSDNVFQNISLFPCNGGTS